MRLRSVAILGLVSLGLVLAGCTQPNYPAVGVSVLFNASQVSMTEYFETGLIMYNGTLGDPSDRLSPGTLVPERIPAWASDIYSVCVHWQDNYRIRSENGPMGRGVVQGWVLIDKGLATHILELSLVSDESGETVLLIDQWDGPAAEDG